MGTTSKVLSVLLRLAELSSSVIVVGLLSRFFYYLHIGPNVTTNGRLIYAQVISCLEIIASIVLIVPAKYSFYAWPIDILFFICSIVAFGLLAALNSSCSSNWYWNYWGYYWGRFWIVAPRNIISPAVIGDVGCGSWKTILAFLFIGAMSWMLSASLGGYVFMEIREGHETHNATAIKEKVMRKNHQVADSESQQQP